MKAKATSHSARQSVPSHLRKGIEALGSFQPKKGGQPWPRINPCLCIAGIVRSFFALLGKAYGTPSKTADCMPSSRKHKHAGIKSFVPTVLGVSQTWKDDKKGGSLKGGRNENHQRRGSLLAVLPRLLGAQVVAYRRMAV